MVPHVTGATNDLFGKTPLAPVCPVPLVVVVIHAHCVPMGDVHAGLGYHGLPL